MHLGHRRIYAHRGLSATHPENTLAAVRACAPAGVCWAEIDVDILGDGTAIVCHDSTLDRTTNRAGGYYQLSRGDLAGIDAGAWFGADFAGEPLPTLGQMLEVANDCRLNLNIELKSNEAGAQMSRQLLDSVLGELEALEVGREVIISSFNHLLLYLLKQQAPQLPVACLYTREMLAPDWRSVLELVGADFIHVQAEGLRAEEVALARSAGFGVNVWTVNSKARANELFNWGVNGIFTDIAQEFPAGE